MLRRIIIAAVAACTIALGTACAPIGDIYIVGADCNLNLPEDCGVTR